MKNAEIIQLLKEYRTHLLKLHSYEEYDYNATKAFLNKNRNSVQRYSL